MAVPCVLESVAEESAKQPPETQGKAAGTSQKVKDFRYAFEFRDPSWFDDRICDALKQAGAAFCMYHLAG